MSGLARVLLFRAECLNRYISRHFPSVGRHFQGEHVALHGWNPGAVELSAEEARLLREAQGGGPSSPAHEAVRAWLPRSFLDEGPLDEDRLDRLVARAALNFPAIQHFRELRRFLALVAGRAPRTVVEIGTGSGGMFFCLCQAAAAAAVVVGIDIGRPGPDEDHEVLGGFARAGQRCHLIRGSSLALSSVRALEDLLRGRRIDLLFIDGSHDYGAVKSDFQLYRRLVAPGGIIAFHDITVTPGSHGAGMDVGVLWSELRRHYATEEIIDPDGARSSAEWRERLAELAASQPELFQAPGGLSAREALALALGSEFVAPRETSPTVRKKRAAPYRSVLDIPGRYQMAWGIGVLHGAGPARAAEGLESAADPG